MNCKQITRDKRQPILAERRNLKMARSAHAYVRGNTVKFYEWLLTKNGKAIPSGPPVWICGDCHLGNLGPLADVKGRVEIAIRDLDRTVDAAYWMKGCSSLGRLRYAVLLQVGKKHRKDGGLCIVDMKEAIKAPAPTATRRRAEKNNAERVVEGASRLSPFLGQRMLAARFMNRDVFLRELMPQDLKLELDQLTRKEAVSAARYLASVVGKAHGRQMDAATRNGWKKELDRHRAKGVDAPSWLWTSVVDLVASHEAAYLEHCREYSNAKPERSKK